MDGLILTSDVVGANESITRLSKGERRLPSSPGATDPTLISEAPQQHSCYHFSPTYSRIFRKWTSFS